MTEEAFARPPRQTFEPYDPAWPVRFEAVAKRLRAVLPDAEVEHYGSTSVPGLGGRPILDVQLAVPDVGDVDHYQPALLGLGYVPFVPPDLVPLAESGLINYVPTDGSNTVHIAVCTIGGVHNRRTLAVRDYLRAHRDEAEAYAQVKRHAAEVAEGVRARYGATKSAFVVALQERAIAWKEAQPAAR